VLADARDPTPPMHCQLGIEHAEGDQGVQLGATQLLLGREDMGSVDSAEVWQVRQVHGSERPYSY
jgi:hypothetical protein